jgi:hypothetical protein
MSVPTANANLRCSLKGRGWGGVYDLGNRTVPDESRASALRRLGGRHETGSKIRLALETAGIEFIDENGGGPGVRLRKRQKK